MNTRLLIGLLTTLGAGALFAAAPQNQSPASDTGVIYIDKAKADAVYAKGGSLIPRGNGNFNVMAARHDTPGGGEIHTLDTDIFYITEGAATFVTGGTIPDQKPSGENEIRGKEVTGGTVHQLKKGDVIVIPKGVPHQFKEITQAPVLYFVVKVR